MAWFAGMLMKYSEQSWWLRWLIALLLLSAGLYVHFLLFIIGGMMFAINLYLVFDLLVPRRR